MEFHILNTDPKIAELLETEQIINSTQDALDVLGTADYHGADAVIFYEHQINPEFFNLRSGLAGEILQKFSNYQKRLTIVGNFENVTSNALKAFIIECNRGSQIFFQSTREAAVQKLSQ